MAAGSKRRSRAANGASKVKSRVMLGGMPRALGVNLISISKKKVVAEMPVRPIHMNRSNRVNGGALMAFGDVCGAAGAVANMPPGNRGGTIESKTNFFAAGQGPVLKAVSIPLHVGRTTSVWQTTIRNTDGRMVAIVTQTQISLPAKTTVSMNGEGNE